jgi:fluoride ion exporter CrcB/FEX
VNHQHALPPVPIWKLIAVACAGGFVGSAARAAMELGCSTVGLPGWTARVVVNVLGACAIGILFARLCDVDGRGIPIGFSHKNRFREQLWGAGFLGGFTTVSGFAWDVASALQDQAFERAAVLLTADAVVGIAAAALGYSITMARRQLRERKGAA